MVGPILAASWFNRISIWSIQNDAKGSNGALVFFHFQSKRYNVNAKIDFEKKSVLKLLFVFV